jgi:hypothetical protein
MQGNILDEITREASHMRNLAYVDSDPIYWSASRTTGRPRPRPVCGVADQFVDQFIARVTFPWQHACVTFPFIPLHIRAMDDIRQP